MAKQEFGGYTSQTAKTFSSFTVISLVDAREGSFPFRSRFEKVLKFCSLAEKRGSLEGVSGVRERGFKLENRNPTRLVQKPKRTRLKGKSENVYSGTWTFWFFRDRSNIKSVYRSTHSHFCHAISSILASVPISSDFDFPA